MDFGRTYLVEIESVRILTEIVMWSDSSSNKWFCLGSGVSTYSFIKIYL